MSKSKTSAYANMFVREIAKLIVVECRFFTTNTVHLDSGVTFKLKRRVSKMTSANKVTWSADPEFKELVDKVPTGAGGQQSIVVTVPGDKISVNDGITLARLQVQLTPASGNMDCEVTYYVPDDKGAQGTKFIISSKQFNTPQLNAPQSVGLEKSSTFPQLVRGLNDTKVDDDPRAAALDFKSPKAKEIEFLRAYLFERLRMGLAPVWAFEDKRVKNVQLDFKSGDEEKAMFQELRSLSSEEFYNEVLVEADDGDADAKDKGTKDKGAPPTSKRVAFTDDEMRRWVADELFARQVTEVLNLTPYNGTDALYGFGYVSAPQAYRKTMDPSDPAHPLSNACQYLATTIALGYGVELIPTGKNTSVQELEASSRTAAVIAGRKGSWYVKPDAPEAAIPASVQGRIQTFNPDPKMLTSEGLFQVKEFGPGSVFVWSCKPEAKWKKPYKILDEKWVRLQIENAQTHELTDGDKWEYVVGTDGLNYGQDNTMDAHIAAVIRVDKKKKVFQTFDTGGANARPLGGGDRNKGLTLLLPQSDAMHTGNHDDPASIGVSSGDPFRGVGTLPVPSVDTVKKTVQLWRKSRPVGLARLVITKSLFNIQGMSGSTSEIEENTATMDKWLVYASPMVRMYTGEPTDNFTYSRYAWSLRALPGREELTAIWLVYAPKDALAAAMYTSPRDTRLPQLIDAAEKIRKDKNKAPEHTGTHSQYLVKHVTGMMDLVSQVSGLALRSWCYNRKKPDTNGLRTLLASKAGIDAAPWDKESGSASGLAALPYFTDEWK